jgi:hypothetical protein
MTAHRRRLAAVAVAGALTPLAAAPGLAAAADAAHPAVVELFQSQGCSSCPPANARVMALADRPDVLALSWQVTYWDQLGWRDTFGSPAFTARQWAYAHAWRRGQVATPEVVVNGRIDGIGSRPGEVEALIARADRGAGGPSIRLTPGAVRVSGAAPAHPAEVWLVRYDPRILQVPIRRGENGGKTLPHRNVVRELVRLGAWTGGARSFALPRSAGAELKAAVLVQEGAGGPITAAARA